MSDERKNAAETLDELSGQRGWLTRAIHGDEYAERDPESFDALSDMSLDDATMVGWQEFYTGNEAAVNRDHDNILMADSEDVLVVNVEDVMVPNRNTSLNDAVKIGLESGEIGVDDVHTLADLGNADVDNGNHLLVVDARTDAERLVDDQLANYQSYSEPMLGGLLQRGYGGTYDLMKRGEPVQGDGTWTFAAPTDEDGALAGSRGGKLEYDEETHLLTLRADRSGFGTMDSFKESERSGVAWDVSDDVPSMNEYGEWQIRVDDPSTIQWNEDGSVTIPDLTQRDASADVNLDMIDDLPSGDALTSTNVLDGVFGGDSGLSDVFQKVTDFVSDKFGADVLDGLVVAGVPAAAKDAASVAKDSSGLEL